MLKEIGSHGRLPCIVTKPWAYVFYTTRQVYGDLEWARNHSSSAQRRIEWRRIAHFKMKQVMRVFNDVCIHELLAANPTLCMDWYAVEARQ